LNKDATSFNYIKTYRKVYIYSIYKKYDIITYSFYYNNMSVESVSNFERGVTQRNRIWNLTRSTSEVFKSPEHPKEIVVQQYDLGNGITLNLGKTNAPQKDISGDAVMVMGTDYTKSDFAFAVLCDGATVGGGPDFKASEVVINSAKQAIESYLPYLQKSDSRKIEESEVIKQILTDTRDFALAEGKKGTSTVNLVVVNTRTGNTFVRYLGDSPIYAVHKGEPLVKASIDHSKDGIDSKGRNRTLLGAGICLHSSRFSADHTIPVADNLGYDINSLTRHFNILRKHTDIEVNVDGVVIASDGIANIRLVKQYTKMLNTPKGLATFIEHGTKSKNDDQTIIYIEGTKRRNKETFKKATYISAIALAIAGTIFFTPFKKFFGGNITQPTIVPTTTIVPTNTQVPTETATSNAILNTETPTLIPTETPTAIPTQEPTPTRSNTATNTPAPTATLRAESTATLLPTATSVRPTSTPLPENLHSTNGENNVQVEYGKVYSLFDEETGTMLQFVVYEDGSFGTTPGNNGLFDENDPISRTKPGQSLLLTWGDRTQQEVSLNPDGTITAKNGRGDKIQ
jgi:hypothetical protein